MESLSINATIINPSYHMETNQNQLNAPHHNNIPIIHHKASSQITLSTSGYPPSDDTSSNLQRASNDSSSFISTRQDSTSDNMQDDTDTIETDPTTTVSFPSLSVIYSTGDHTIDDESSSKAGSKRKKFTVAKSPKMEDIPEEQDLEMTPEPESVNQCPQQSQHRLCLDRNKKSGDTQLTLTNECLYEDHDSITATETGNEKSTLTRQDSDNIIRKHDTINMSQSMITAHTRQTSNEHSDDSASDTFHDDSTSSRSVY